MQSSDDVVFTMTSFSAKKSEKNNIDWRGKNLKV